MIRKSGNRFSEKITLKKRNQIGIGFRSSGSLRCRNERSNVAGTINGQFRRITGAADDEPFASTNPRSLATVLVRLPAFLPAGLHLCRIGHPRLAAAVLCRATLGHTGQQLTASLVTQ